MLVYYSGRPTEQHYDSYNFCFGPSSFFVGPRIDVVGRTTFSYDSDRGNRIFSYDEVWEMEPAEALMQLFRPAGKEEDDGTLVLPQEEE